MGSIIILIIIGVAVLILFIIIAIISAIFGLIGHAAPGFILRLIARKDVQSLSETAEANKGFAVPQGSEVNEDNYG